MEVQLVKLSEKQMEFAWDVSLLILWIRKCGYACTFGEAFRTKEQAEWNAKKGKGIVNSLHRRRLAIDLNLFKGGKYLSTTIAHKKFGEYWESLDPKNRWGGRFGDGNHYERRP